MKTYNIAIDGPAGAGKSTIARLAAAELRFIYVDTGAMYRAIGLHFCRAKIAPSDVGIALEETLRGAAVTIRHIDGEQVVLLNGENVNGLIRTEEIGKMTSALAALAPVRDKLLQLQRELAKESSVIMDGRDIGSKVLPDADLKIYLTADAMVRAERRHLELLKKGENCNIEEILRDILQRDERDMTREASPLKKAEDAILVDTSSLTIEEAKDRIIELFHKKCNQ